MERYSNIPITKLAIVQPPSRGFPGIDRYGFAGILSYIKSAVDRHVSIDGGWRESHSGRQPPSKDTTIRTFTLRQNRPGQTRSEDILNVGIMAQDDEIFVSLGFSPDIEDVRDDVMKDIFKTDSAEAIEGAPFSFRVDNSLSMYEDDEDFFNLPSETYPFEPGNPVPARQHTNPNGSFGGWVAESASVGPDVYLGPDAKVFGTAQVSGNAHISDNAEIYDNAQVSGEAKVSGDTQVYGEAQVSGGRITSGTISGEAHVSGGIISGNVHISGEATVGAGYISGNAQSGTYIFGNAAFNNGSISGGEIFGRANINKGSIKDNAKVYDNAQVTGGTISDHAQVFGNAEVKDGNISGNAKISGTAIINKGANITTGKITNGTHP